MIRTGEQILDPVEFFRAEGQELIAEMNEQGFLCVAGPDLDVGIQRTATETGFGRQEVGKSPLLRSLYMEGSCLGIELPDGQGFANLYWSPSPEATNSLHEELGLEVGKDVLRLVHAEADGIKRKSYVYDFFANGCYPLSTQGKRLFRHDRRAVDHVGGLTLMPTAISGSVVDRSSVASQKNKRVRSLTGDLDSLTMNSTNLTRLIVQGPSDEDTPGYDSFHYSNVISLWLPRKSPERRVAENKPDTVLRLYEERYESIRDKIDRLHAERAASLAQRQAS